MPQLIIEIIKYDISSDATLAIMEERTSRPIDPPTDSAVCIAPGITASFESLIHLPIRNGSNMPDVNLEGLEFCCTLRARSEMIDYNGHLNVGYYGIFFEEGARAVFSRLDISRAYRGRTGRALFGIEAHMTFLKEVLQDEEVDLYFRLAGLTDRALHALFLMVNRPQDALAAVQEVLYLHVDLASRRVVPMPETIQDRLADLRMRQNAWPIPFELGRRIALRPAKS